MTEALVTVTLLAIIIGALVYAVRKWPGWKPAPPPGDSIMEQGYEAVERAKERLKQTTATRQ